MSEYIYNLDNFEDVRMYLNNIITDIENMNKVVFDIRNDINSFNVSFNFWKDSVDDFISKYPSDVQSKILKSKNEIVAIINKHISDTFWVNITRIDKRIDDIIVKLLQIDNELTNTTVKAESPMQYVQHLEVFDIELFKLELKALYYIWVKCTNDKYDSLKQEDKITGSEMIDINNIIEDIFIV